MFETLTIGAQSIKNGSFLIKMADWNHQNVMSKVNVGTTYFNELRILFWNVQGIVLKTNEIILPDRP